MAKIKAKTKRAADKRFRISATGKLKHKHAYRSHLAHNKSVKQKRHARKDAFLNPTFNKKMKETIHN